MKREFIEDIGTYDIGEVMADEQLLRKYFRRIPEKTASAIKRTFCINCLKELSRGYDPIVFRYDEKNDVAQWWHYMKCVDHPHQFLVEKILRKNGDSAGDNSLKRMNTVVNLAVNN